MSNSLLRQDVRFLGKILGDVIRDQEGVALLNKIEKIRHFAKQIRKSHAPAFIAKKRRLIQSLSVPEAYKIARAFTIYFQLANIAEEAERIRRLRAYDKHNQLQHMSVRKLFHDLSKRKISERKVSRLVNRLDIELVLTAHPTEVKRRTILSHILEIASSLSQINHPDATNFEKETHTLKIKELLEILWQTKPTRTKKVSVLDEVDQTLFFFEKTIFPLIPAFHRIVQKSHDEFYESTGKISDLPLVRFGSWVGADRDGNPNVTCQVTEETARRHRELIFTLYLNACEALMLKFSQSDQMIGAGRSFLASLANDRRLMPKLASELDKYESSELYRKKLSFIHRKLSNTYQQKSVQYQSPDEFLADLLIIQESLQKNKGRFAVAGDLENLICQVRVFGFHLAALDFRDDSRKIMHAVKELFGFEPTAGQLIGAITKKNAQFKKARRLSAESKDIIRQLELIKEIQEKMGRSYVKNYLLSMAEKPEDILGFMYLAVRAGLIKVKGKKVVESCLAIVPLFEKIESLAEAHLIMQKLFSLPLYRSYVQSQGNLQEIMFGYSDSNKDGGYFAANWKLYLAQKRMVEMAEKFNVAVRFFHGKGGTIDRGGGQSHKAILAQPYAAVGGKIRITEQGEVVSQKYANLMIAQRNLEQLATAVIWTNLVGKHEWARSRKIAEWEKKMEELCQTSLRFYRDLVFDSPGFKEFFYSATPIQLFGIAQIGSRPASRKRSREFQDLRAIPWVFSWVQSRFILPAWYGIGYALEAEIKQSGKKGLAELREMYQKWPFFHMLIDNARVSLAKADMYIAERYSALVDSEAVRSEIFGRIKEEYARSCDQILEITGQDDLLGFHPVLKESIRLRNPYVDPLNFLQVRFLEESKKSTNQSAVRQNQIKDVLLLALNGIAFGMKSTG